MEEDLRAAIEDGSIDVRGPLGQAFYRAHKKGTPGAQAYSGCKRQAAKAKFRVEWAKTELKLIKDEHTHTEAEEIINSNSGMFLPFRKIWEAEGLDSEGYEAIQ